MSGQPDITRFISFNEFLLQFRAVDRKVYIPPGSDRPENDAEHSYNLAMATWYLAQYFPNIDSARAVQLALAHDLVEVHAGDTFAYGQQKDLASKAQREAAAMDQLKTDWPDFPEMSASIEEYEAKETEEAKFVYALDKLMPAILNYLGDGHAWHKHNITFDKFLKEKEAKIPVSPEIHDYHLQFVEILKNQSHYFPEKA